MNLLTFLILSLAAYRITHLLVFDKVFEPLRKYFVERTVIFGSDGQPQFVFSLPPSRIRSIIGRILNCPWCCGVWVAGFVALTQNVMWLMWLYEIMALSAVIGLVETFWMKTVGLPEMREKKTERR